VKSDSKDHDGFGNPPFLWHSGPGESSWPAVGNFHCGDPKKSHLDIDVSVIFWVEKYSMPQFMSFCSWGIWFGVLFLTRPIALDSEFVGRSWGHSTKHSEVFEVFWIRPMPRCKHPWWECCQVRSNHGEHDGFENPPFFVTFRSQRIFLAHSREFSLRWWYKIALRYRCRCEFLGKEINPCTYLWVFVTSA
jgi:hypothetical protein